MSTWTLICPPVNPFSPLEAIDAWIAYLEPRAQAVPDDEGFRQALESARRMRADVAANWIPKTDANHL